MCSSDLVSILDRLVRGGALEPRGEGLALRPGATVVAPTSDARWDDALAAVGRLGADAVTAFDLLAVLGSATSAEWVAARRTAGVRGPHDLEELLARSEMIRERRGRWELTDPGLRDRVMHLRVSQLQDLHLICSRVIHDPGRRGVHLVGAGRLDEGASLLLDAARSAEVANEPFDTLDLAATALDALDRLPAGEADPRRAQVALLQARAHIELGHPDAVLAAVAVLVAGAENAGWEAAVADGLRCRARVLRTQGRLDEAEAAFGLALEAAELAGEPALAGHALLGRALVERSRGRLDEALATLAEASRRLPEGEQAQIALTIGAIRMQQGAAGDARRWLERAAAAASLVGSRSTLAQATNVLAELDRREGDLDAAELGYQQALRLLELSGARAQTIFPRLNLALLGFARERWRDARTQLLDVLADVEDQGRDGLAGACHAMLLAPAVALGDPVAFDRHATLALERLRRTGFREPDTLASLRLALALTSDPDQRRRCRELVATQE